MFFQPGYADGADLFVVCGSRNIDEINFSSVIPFLRTIQYNTRYTVSSVKGNTIG